MSLDSVDKHNIDEEAAALARRDLSANRIAASDLGATIEKYAAELTEKAKDSKAAALFSMLCCAVNCKERRTHHEPV